MDPAPLIACHETSLSFLGSRCHGWLTQEQPNEAMRLVGRAIAFLNFLYEDYFVLETPQLLAQHLLLSDALVTGARGAVGRFAVEKTILAKSFGPFSPQGG